MEILKINRITKKISGTIQVTGSKSETNRLLILQQIYPNLEIENASNSDDSILLENALNSKAKEINIGHAGTAMRFLTAYFSNKADAKVVLTGSRRMKERPIKILVEALRSLGASIEYLENEGYPPISIHGRELTGSEVVIDGNVSSQYITALLLIAPSLKNGLRLKFKGAVTSVPYIKMTLKLLNELGVQFSWDDGVIDVQAKNEISNKKIVVESDWSSASYFYSLVALNSGSQIKLSSYKLDSLQGDAVLHTLFESIGVSTKFEKDSITLNHTPIENVSNQVNLNLINAPDIAQTIAVTCFGKGLGCYLTGLHTLKIKETDRLVALKNEIEKMGGTVTITKDSLRLESGAHLRENCTISTYNDHRMALSFSVLASKVDLAIEDPGVVSKSFPTYWEDFKQITR